MCLKRPCTYHTSLGCYACCGFDLFEDFTITRVATIGALATPRPNRILTRHVAPRSHSIRSCRATFTVFRGFVLAGVKGGGGDGDNHKICPLFSSETRLWGDERYCSSLVLLCRHQKYTSFFVIRTDESCPCLPSLTNGKTPETPADGGHETKVTDCGSSNLAVRTTRLPPNQHPPSPLYLVSGGVSARAPGWW